MTLQEGKSKKYWTSKRRRSSKNALYVGSTAFYLTFFYIWKCSFWLLCRPWYLFIYFGMDYRPLIRHMSLTQWCRVPRKVWCQTGHTTLWKYTKVMVRTPFTVVVFSVWLTIVGPWRLSQALKRGLHGRGMYIQSQTGCIEDQLLLTYPDDFKVLAQHNGKLKFFKNLPLRQISYLWGQFVNLPYFPGWFRVLGLKYYIWLYGCNFEEAANQDLRSYKTLGDFFRRPLRSEVRPIHGTASLVSPADGCIMQFGTVQDGLLEQVKGVTFPLMCFLGPVYNDDVTATVCFNSVIKRATRQCTPSLLEHSTASSDTSLVPKQREAQIVTEDNRQYYSVFTELLLSLHNALYYFVVYLSPGDYHRFHSPVDWTVTGRRHFTGNLYSVKPSMASWLQGLFCVNERVTYVGKWKHGFFSMTAVGALNVGSITVFFDETLQTNSRSATQMGVYEDHSFVRKKQKGVTLKKGQLMGDFNLGSTIVLLFEAPGSFSFNIKPHSKVKYGQFIGN